MKRKCVPIKSTVNRVFTVLKWIDVSLNYKQIYKLNDPHAILTKHQLLWCTNQICAPCYNCWMDHINSNALTHSLMYYLYFEHQTLSVFDMISEENILAGLVMSMVKGSFFVLCLIVILMTVKTS